MQGKKILAVVVVGLLAFALGWFLHGGQKRGIESGFSEKTNSFSDTTANADTLKINNGKDFSGILSGRFIMKKATCAGFNFIDDKIVLWTNEIACYDPDTLKIRWLDGESFMTRSTERINVDCPPLVNLYKVVSFDGKHLVLKSIWTGWNDFRDDNLEFYKQATR